MPLKKFVYFIMAWAGLKHSWYSDWTKGYLENIFIVELLVFSYELP